MKKKLFSLVLVMMLILSTVACGGAQEDDGTIKFKKFETFLGDPIELTTENWQDYIELYVDKQEVTDEEGNYRFEPSAYVMICLKDGYYCDGMVGEYEGENRQIEIFFEGMDSSICITNGSGYPGFYVHDYSNIVCSGITGSVRPMNVPEEYWIKDDLMGDYVQVRNPYEEIFVCNVFQGSAYLKGNNTDAIPVSELPEVHGYISEEEFESYIVETIEIDANNVEEYMDIIQIETESFDAFGDVIGTSTTTYLDLKEGYYVYSDELIIRYTIENEWGENDTDTTFYQYENREYIYIGNEEEGEFTRAQGTIVKVEVPEEEWVPYDADNMYYSMYYEDGDDFIVVYGKDGNRRPVFR